MNSLWSDKDAEAAVARYANAGIERDLALRVYTSRLLGGDPALVLHGGGNTSLKATATGLAGEKVEALYVKGSGWDMAALEPAGLSAVRLAVLRTLRARDALSDEEMVRVLRASRVDPDAPNPSVETLLHAFVPHKFVDHTHSAAVLGLSDQPDGVARCAALYAGLLGVVPYIMPGFQLAKRAAEIYEQDPAVEGLVLAKHGIVTFGDTAREAYERMIAAASRAEDRLQHGRKSVFAAAKLPPSIAPVETVAPILRGACALPEPGHEYKRFVMDFRTGPAVRNLVDGVDIARYGRAGVATPDHTIRTKNYPLIVPAPLAGGLDDFAASVREAVAAFIAEYHAYFARNNAAIGGIKHELDAAPRVILVPGLGLFGLGRNAKDAAIAADLAESWVATVTDAEAVGTFESLTEAQLFEMEYWAPEQAKLGTAPEKPLQGQIAVVTGGAGTIGLATARALRAEGAEIALLDREAAAPDMAAKTLGGIGVACDVTEATAVAAAFERVVARFGGVDIIVSNAGAAWQGKIGEVDEKTLRDSFELNFFAHQSVAQQAVKIMQAQRTGGCLLFNVSRQAVSPGPDFGPYGMPKAATLALMRQYALEYGAEGIRSNAVNADGIRGGLLTEEMIAKRAAAYKMTIEQYMGRNLLRHEVTAQDVAAAFVDLARARSTTGSFIAVDGGNIAAAPR